MQGVDEFLQIHGVLIEWLPAHDPDPSEHAVRVLELVGVVLYPAFPPLALPEGVGFGVVASGAVLFAAGQIDLKSFMCRVVL